MKNMSLGERLKIAREKKGLSQLEVSEKTGIGNASISNYEGGYRKTPPAAIAILAQLYGVSTDWIHGLTNDPTPIKKISPTGIDLYPEGDKKYVFKSNDKPTEIDLKVLETVNTLSELSEEEKEAILPIIQAAVDMAKSKSK